MQDRTLPRRTVSLVVLAAALILLILVAPDVLLVIFAGILFAAFFGGGGGWIARKTGMPRPLGIGVFILLILAVLGGAMAGFAPAMAKQFDQLTREIPSAFESLRERVEQYSWGERVTEAIDPSGLMSSESGLAAASAVTGTFGALGNFVIMLFIGIYGALNPGLYRSGVLALLAPSLRPRADEAMDKAGNTLRSWLSAQLMAMTAVGVLTGLGLWLIGIPLAFILGLIAGLLAFIPNIGPVLAAMPGVLLALPEGTNTVLMAIGVYVAVQALESYVFTPLIQQEKVSLPPALIITAQLLLGVLFGILGLAMATPLAAVGMTLVSALYVEDYLERERA